jgi:hypothetical protein
MSLAMYGLTGALLLALSSVLGLKLALASGPSAKPRDLDKFLAVAGGIGSIAGLLFFLQFFSFFGIIFWLLACIGFAAATWDRDERTCALVGFVSLIVGVVLLFVGLLGTMRGA